MLTAVLACLAGGLGAVARALADEALATGAHRWRSTLAVNLTGSLLLGFASVTLPVAWLPIVGTGFFGGFTTFSTACWQAARELGLRRFRVGLGYAAATVAGCLAAAWLGLRAGELSLQLGSLFA